MGAVGERHEGNIWRTLIKEGKEVLSLVSSYLTQLFVLFVFSPSVLHFLSFAFMSF